MGAEVPGGSDGYAVALERAAWREELAGLIRLSGSDAISFLHNVLTNDIESLGPGQARYTAYLTPQGRMISDADVIRRFTAHDVASGVTVVTTEHEGRPYGMTVASFASLSLNPPLVLVCIEKNVKSHDAIAAARTFGVSILEESQADISGPDRRGATSV